MLVSFAMTTAKKKTAKKPAAKKAPAKKAPAKKTSAAPKKAVAKKVATETKKATFVDSNKFFEEVAAKQIAEHADKIEELINSIPAQVTVDARGVKSWLRKLFKNLSK